MIPVRSVQDPLIARSQPLDLAWFYPNLHQLQWCLPAGLKSTKRQNLLRHTCPGKKTLPRSRKRRPRSAQMRKPKSQRLEWMVSMFKG